MIHYALSCGRGHAFDGWFASSEAFDSQARSGAVACPVCGSADVSRALMAPAVRTRSTTRPAAPDTTEVAPAEHAVKPTHATHASISKADRQKFVEAVRQLRTALVENGTDVGTAFPEEARRIHYGEAEPRGIYGQAAPQEARELIEEGIEILPIPTLPEDRN